MRETTFKAKTPSFNCLSHMSLQQRCIQPLQFNFNTYKYT